MDLENLADDARYVFDATVLPGKAAWHDVAHRLAGAVLAEIERRTRPAQGPTIPADVAEAAKEIVDLGPKIWGRAYEVARYVVGLTPPAAGCPSCSSIGYFTRPCPKCGKVVRTPPAAGPKEPEDAA